MTKKEFEQFKSSMDGAFVDHCGKFTWEDFVSEAKSNGRTVKEEIFHMNFPYAETGDMRQKGPLITLKDLKAYFAIPWCEEAMTEEQQEELAASR